MQIDEDDVTSELESFPCNKDFFADADPQPVQLVCHDYFTVWPVIADSLFERITSAPRLIRVGRVLRLDQLVTSEHGASRPFPTSTSTLRLQIG
jgi:hypothetical protein